MHVINSLAKMPPIPDVPAQHDFALPLIFAPVCSSFFYFFILSLCNALQPDCNQTPTCLAAACSLGTTLAHSITLLLPALQTNLVCLQARLDAAQYPPTKASDALSSATNLQNDITRVGNLFSLCL